MLSRLVIAVVLVTPFTSTLLSDSSKISLAGEWSFQLDPMDLGYREQWFQLPLPERVKLPGTTDQNLRGFPLDKETMTYQMSHSGRSTVVQVLRTQWPATQLASRADEAGHLVREWYYVGKAWYQRSIEIPENWSNKRIHLRLERVLWKSQVWIDSRYVGLCDSLVTEHLYDLGDLEPGIHRLTICVDNGMVHNIGILGHSYGPETQTRWNGIVGDMELQALPEIFLAGLQVFPDANRQQVRLKVDVINSSGTSREVDLLLEIGEEVGDNIVGAKQTRLTIAPGSKCIEDVVSVTKPVQAWDEFNPVRYRLTARISKGQNDQQQSTLFGFRHLRSQGKSIILNDRKMFLRGLVDCAVYPRAGHPPMKVEEWLKVLGTVKEYGFNHVRFHTWCPPEAAFEAADRLGVYLAPETPFWVDNWTVVTSSYPKLMGSDEDVTRYVRSEINRISKAYGNHPSFAFFCIGNEFGSSSDWKLINQLLAEIRGRDPRRLYNATTARKTVAADDYWVTHDSGSARTRGIGPPHTNWDFSKATDSAQLPIIAHETGQRPVFPDFDELLPKFTGPLKPYNLERLQELLKLRGLDQERRRFMRASARFQYVQYKAEHEAIHRSPELSGYQLLMLNDFTGQSEALVGILDPFWEEKGIIRSEEIRQWNAPTVLLARFDRYLWSANEDFSAEIEVSHFGPVAMKDVEIAWSLRTDTNLKVAEGRLSPVDIPTGGLTKCGRLDASLTDISGPVAMTLELAANGLVNHWPLWVYPSPSGDSTGNEVLIFDQFNDAFREALAEGKIVLFLAHGLKNEKTAKTGFASVYWSAGWWGNEFSSLGIVCDPTHPALAGFPNSGHSDWQWYELTRDATTFLLDAVPPGFKPIVQAVPDFHFSALLGQVFEARVGPGRLLVCGYDLQTDWAKRPAASQLRDSLLRYMRSKAFRPQHSLSLEQLNQLLSQ